MEPKVPRLLVIEITPPSDTVAPQTPQPGATKVSTDQCMPRQRRHPRIATLRFFIAGLLVRRDDQFAQYVYCDTPHGGFLRSFRVVVADSLVDPLFDPASPGRERLNDFLVSANLNPERPPLTWQARRSAESAFVDAQAGEPAATTDASMAVFTGGPIGHMVGFSDYVHDSDCSSYTTFCQEMLQAGFPRNADVL